MSDEKDLSNLTPNSSFLNLMSSGTKDRLQASWNTVRTMGTPPKITNYHTSVIHNDCLWVFGGFKRGHGTNDLFCLDLSTLIWRSIFNPNKRKENQNSQMNNQQDDDDLKSIVLEKEYWPEGRYHHNSVVFKDKLYIFGGVDDKVYRNDLWEFDIIQEKWRRIEVENPPSPRNSSVMAVYKNKLYLFGGVQDKNVLLNDFWEFNFVSNEWKKLKPKGELPCKRHFHSGSIVGPFFYIFGGSNGKRRLNDLYRYEFDTGYFMLIDDFEGNLPQTRRNHTCVSYKEKLYIAGGYGKTSLNDLHVYNTDTSTWSMLCEESSFSPRHFHTASVWKQKMFVFGGWNGRQLNDLHSYTFPDSHEVIEEKQIKEDMRYLFQKQAFFDIEMITAQKNRIICAHWCVLKARVGQWNDLVITDSENLKIIQSYFAKESYLVVRSLMIYLYCDQCDVSNLSNPEIFDLIRISNSLGLSRLTAMCEHSVKTSINSENVFQIMASSEKYSLRTLREMCFDYILNHREILFQQSNQLNEFSHEFLMELFRASSSPNQQRKQIVIEIPESTFIEDLERLHSDFIEKNDFAVCAHKAILVAHSKLFSRQSELIDNNNDDNEDDQNENNIEKEKEKQKEKEKEKKKKETPEIFPDRTNRNVIEIGALVKFLYSGRIDHIQSNPEIALKLIGSVQDYQLTIQSFDKVCVNIVKRNADVENIIKILSYAHDIESKELKQYAMNFIIHNREQILKSQSFKKINSVELLHEIIKHLFQAIEY
ncbi:leucine-zipper-like transcriptional regulator 1 [Anaeramoeba flamelloides]|uniref:Leucine-zipper-like transcriptional regulator 1 n=1 Tax=Anaeramoeba flamelloides TaxID=1746091 RepID=A0ABQ8YTD2_9EUKA|nr:leucine-zipper-like transcriptional regulator 1 [Anaeramoeba flamelloides]